MAEEIKSKERKLKYSKVSYLRGTVEITYSKHLRDRAIESPGNEKSFAL